MVRFIPALVVNEAQVDEAASLWADSVAAVQRGDDRVHRAVAAGDHDRAGARAVQDAVELAGVGGRRDLDRGRLAQHRQPPLERLVVGGAGVAVLDDEEGLHESGP